MRAVGLCGVIAAKRLGAEQFILMGRRPDRIALARAFGATDVVSERVRTMQRSRRSRSRAPGALSEGSASATEGAER